MRIKDALAQVQCVGSRFLPDPAAKNIDLGAYQAYVMGESKGGLYAEK